MLLPCSVVLLLYAIMLLLYAIVLLPCSVALLLYAIVLLPCSGLPGSGKGTPCPRPLGLQT